MARRRPSTRPDTRGTWRASPSPTTRRAPARSPTSTRPALAYLSAFAAVDPSASTTEPPSPWFGIFDARPANSRYYLVHQIEEMARHAGHADIIHEQIDGMAVPAIMLSEAGTPANDFFEPYVPAPGTIGAR